MLVLMIVWLAIKRLNLFTTKNKRVDTSKALRDLKHKPTIGLEDGVARTVAWMREVYKVG